jgi:CRISPR-associated endonuclease Cas1
MTASHNLQQPDASRKSPISKNGILTLTGYGVRVFMQSGHLEIEDGAGEDRRKIRLARVGHGLKRLICVSNDGFITLSALKWLTDTGASFVMLDRIGKLILVTGPPASPNDARLRRAQALSIGNGLGLEISRTLIDAKLQEQERVLREQVSGSCSVQQQIAAFRGQLQSAESVGAVRWIEANAAIAYFKAWRDTPVLWPKADVKSIPHHWCTVGSRHSPLSGGPRLAITPVHAILNYAFALLESESRLALSALGLDPGLGVGLHTDTPNRDSLAFDVLEPVRPKVESWVLNWITREPLRRSDFFEMANGNCRLMSRLCTKLTETTSTWGKLVAPWAEYVARTLWLRSSTAKNPRSLPTRLTQQHRREVWGKSSLPAVEVPKPEHVCRGCGKRIKSWKVFCAECAVVETRENFDAGRKTAQAPQFLAKRSQTQQMHRRSIRHWDATTLPAWLNRDFYITRIQPALARVTKAAIRETLEVSEPYALWIHNGQRVPHPRHWQILAELVGIRR